MNAYKRFDAQPIYLNTQWPHSYLIEALATTSKKTEHSFSFVNRGLSKRDNVTFSLGAWQRAPDVAQHSFLADGSGGVDVTKSEIVPVELVEVDVAVRVRSTSENS